MDSVKKIVLYDNKARKAVDVCRVIVAVLLCVWAFQPIVYSIFAQFFYKTKYINRFVYRGRLWYTFWANPALIILGIGVILCLLLMLAFLLPTSDMKEPFDSKKFFRNSLKHFEFYLFGGILLWSIVSLFFSPNFKVSFFGFDYYKGGVIYYFFYAAMFCGVFALKDNQKKWVLNSFVIVSVFFAVVTLLKNWKVFNEFASRLNNEKGIRLLPTFWAKNSAIYSNQNFYGYFLSFAVVLSAGTFFFERKKTVAFLYLFSFALNEYCLLLNDGMGAFLSVLFSLLFFILAVCISRRRFYSKFIIIFAVFALIFILYSIFGNGALFVSIKGLVKDVEVMSNPSGYSQQTVEEVGSTRFILWKGIWALIMLAPIFGNGIDCYAAYGKNRQFWIENFASRYKTGNLIEYPHNEFLQLAYGAGLPVLIFYVAALGIIYVRAVVKNKQLTNLQLLGLSCAAGYIASSFFGNGWSYMIPNYLIFLAIGIGGTFIPEKSKPILVIDERKAEEERIRAEIWRELEERNQMLSESDD